MKKRMLAKINLFVPLITASVLAAQPNFERTTTYNVDGAGDSIVATEYSDGLRRCIQTKLKLSDTKDRAACTYYDAVGRPSIATKAFVDNVALDEYLPGGIADAAIKAKLEASNLGDTRAFSETQYWDDPLGRVKATIGPGSAYMGNTGNAWTFGVGLTPIPNYALAEGTVDFLNGFIKSINVSDASKTVIDLLNSLNDAFDASNPFTGPTHFLTLSRDPEGKISEQLTDIFGKTVSTFSAPDSNGKTGSKITAGFSFDILGNILAEKPPIAANPVDSTKYKYNTLGQLIWKQSPDGGTFTYTYNPNGSIQTEILWTGGSEEIGNHYYYDAIGRLSEINYMIMGVTELTVIQYFYDNFNNFPKSLFPSILPYFYDIPSNQKGRLAATIAKNRLYGEIIDVAKLFFYDDEGRIQYKVTAITGSPVVQETDFQYDIHGKQIAEYFYPESVSKVKNNL